MMMKTRCCNEHWACLTGLFLGEKQCTIAEKYKTGRQTPDLIFSASTQVIIWITIDSLSCFHGLMLFCCCFVCLFLRLYINNNLFPFLFPLSKSSNINLPTLLQIHGLFFHHLLLSTYMRIYVYTYTRTRTYSGMACWSFHTCTICTMEHTEKGPKPLLIM